MRPSWRGIYVDNIFFAYVFDKKNILVLRRINTRSSHIIRKAIGKVGETHDGKRGGVMDIKERQLYYPFGEFSFTRAEVRQPRNRKKK